jgi:hypothetical protein
MQTRRVHTFCSEVEKAIKEMRNKATGDNDVPGDVLKLLEKVV